MQVCRPDPAILTDRRRAGCRFAGLTPPRTDALLRLLADGAGELLRDGKPISGDEAQRQAALALIDKTLASLEAAALLQTADAT